LAEKRLKDSRFLLDCKLVLSEKILQKLKNLKKQTRAFAFSIKEKLWLK
jgi:hypothetical protein